MNSLMGTEKIERVSRGDGEVASKLVVCLRSGIGNAIPDPDRSDKLIEPESGRFFISKDFPRL